MAFTKEDEQTLIRLFNQVMDEHVPADVHIKHHAWITKKLNEDIRREEMINRIREKLITMGITGGVCTVLAMVWYSLTHGFGSGQ